MAKTNLVAAVPVTDRLQNGGNTKPGVSSNLLAHALVLLCFLGLAARSGGAEKVVVTTISPKVSAIEWKEKVTGEFLAIRRASLQMRNKGTLEKVLVKEGERVKKGALLAQLELINFSLGVEASEKQAGGAAASLKASQSGLEVARAGVRQAEVRLETAARDFERAKTLKSKESITQAQYDQAEGAFKISQAGLELAKKQMDQSVSAEAFAKTQVEMAEVGRKTARQKLEESSLYAPFDGLIVSAPLQAYDHPGDGQNLFILVDDSELELIVKMPERFFPQVKVGTPLSFKTEMSPDEASSSVSIIIPSVDPVNRTFTFKSIISNRDGRFRHGSYADVNVIVARNPNALLLPPEAIRNGGEVKASGHVFLVENGKAKKVGLKLGIERAGMVEVLDGLSADSTVILMGVDKVSDGMEVTVSNEKEK